MQERQNQKTWFMQKRQNQKVRRTWPKVSRAWPKTKISNNARAKQVRATRPGTTRSLAWSRRIARATPLSSRNEPCGEGMLHRTCTTHLSPPSQNAPTAKSPSADEANDGSKQRSGCKQSATTARAAHTAATRKVPLDTDAESMREGTHNGPNGCHGPSPTSTTNRSHGANSVGNGHG